MSDRQSRAPCSLLRAVFTAWLMMVTLAGCAAERLAMTFNCSPQGAYLFDQNTKYVGKCPVTFYYPVTNAERSRGQMRIGAMTAEWISGARASVPALNVDLKKFGYSQQLTLHRPKSAQGVEDDERNALELERERERSRIMRERDDMIRSRETDEAYKDAAEVWGEVLGIGLGRKLSK